MSQPLFQPMTPEEYVTKGACFCPVCASEKIAAIDSIELDGAIGWQTTQCVHCGATWKDHWVISGYSELR